MGFPDWTLWGMGLAALGALLMLLLALAAQSPGFLNRLRNGGRGLSNRARSFTGFALAFLLLALGFFMAGVPLEQQSTAEPADQESVAVTTPGGVVATPVSALPTATPRQTPATGAFAGPPEEEASPSATAASPESEEVVDPATTPAPTEPATEPTSLPTSPATATITETATQTATPLPTLTPTPTMTPTPIAGETAQLNTAGSTVWLRRSPGGENILLLADGATVILGSGHANFAGVLWREVRAVNGISGWILEEFLHSAGDEA